MKQKHISHFYGLFLSFALLIAPLPLSAMVENHEYNDATYIYFGKDFSNIAEVILEISKLDDDYNSPLSRLKNHIDNGFLINDYEIVAQALDYAESIIEEKYYLLDEHYAENLVNQLDTVINQVINGELVYDEKIVREQILKIKEKLYVFCDAKFFECVEIKNNLEVDGKLDVHGKLNVHGSAKLNSLSVNDAIIENAIIQNLSTTNTVVQDLIVINCIPNLCVTNLSVDNAVVQNLLVEDTTSLHDLVVETLVITGAPLFNPLQKTRTITQPSLVVTGPVQFAILTPTGIVHNDAAGNLSTSLIVNADIDPNAAIEDSKLATIVTVGKVDNSATTATSDLDPNTIVLRDASNNFSAGTITANLIGSASLNVLKTGDTMTGPLELPAGTLTNPSLLFTGTAIGISGNNGNLSFSSNGSETMNIASSGVITIDNLIGSAGVVHNNASGNLSSSLIVDADIAPSTIANNKLATISSTGTPNSIVVYDGSGNFSANTITANLIGNASLNVLKAGDSMTGALAMLAQNQIDFYDTVTNFVGIQAPTVVPTSYTLSLPSTTPLGNQILRANAITPTHLEWALIGGSVLPVDSKTIYVTTYGSDLTGDGSFGNPYASLFQAINVANALATLSNPICILVSAGIYTEDNSAGPLTVTANGISIVGVSPTAVIIQPSTPANDLLLVNNTIRIADITFQSSAPLATGVSLSAGILSTFTNMRCINFATGVLCAGGTTQLYGFNGCLFIANSVGLSINNSRVETVGCAFFGAPTLSSPAANTGVSITGAGADLVIDGGSCAKCITGFDITSNSTVTISATSFKLNNSDIIQTSASQMVLSGSSFELTNTSSDITIQISGAGTMAEIVGCQFNGRNLSNITQATGIMVSNNATAILNSNSILYYTTAIIVGSPSDAASTSLVGSSCIINSCTNDIVQQGSATLNFNASTASSNNIIINDPTNVNLAFFDINNNNALTIGSTANNTTKLLQPDINPTNNPSITYTPSLYSAQGVGFNNIFGSPSSLYVASLNNSNLTSITTDRTKTSGVTLVSDTGSPVGGTLALRGWNVNKNGSSAELSFAYQNSDTVGQIAVAPYTVMQLDGLNNLLQLPTAGTQIVFNGDTNLYRNNANVLKTDDNFIVGVLTPGKVVTTDPVTNQLLSSVTTNTELSYLSGTTSSVQTQINSKVSKTGDTMTGPLQLSAGTTASPSLVFTGSTTTGLSASSNNLSFSTNALERFKISSTGVLSVDAFTTAGVVHNNASGNLSSSLIVNADITNNTIANSALATISSNNIPGDIVVRDGSGNFITNMITILGTPTFSTDAATKAYVDAAASTGIVAKTPAIVVGTTDIGSPPATLQTIDGVTLVDGNRVLLTGQTNAVQNGLWVAHAGAWTRPTDFANGSPAEQAYVLILEGTLYIGSSWLCNTPTAIIGTDPITFVQFSLPNQTTAANIGAGTGLIFANKAGATLNFKSLLEGNFVTITNNASDITIDINATNVNTPSTIVERDASGNFSAGTITANLTGAASNNVLKAGDTMTGTLQLPAGTTALPALVFTGSTTTGLSANSNNLSFSTNGTEQFKISSAGVLSVDAFTTAGVVHNDASGNLSSSLIVNADIDPAAGITDSKLATISTAGKVANSATTATSANTPSTIVLRDASGNFSAGTITANLTGTASNNLALTGGTLTGTLQLPAGSTALPSLVFTGSTTTGLSANSNNLSFSTNGTEQFKISSTGVLSVDTFTTPGVVHNDASGNLSSSLIVNADVSPTAGITDSKLATISTAGKVANSATTATSALGANSIVLRDASNNFSAGTITANLTGTASNNLALTGGTLTGTLQLPAGTTALPALVFTGSTTTGLSANSNNLSFSTNGTEQFKISSTGVLSVDTFTTPGVVHNDASGNLSSSLIVNADVSPTAGITDSKLATISTAGKVANSATTATSVNTPSTIVLRDASGNFSAGTITANLIGAASLNVLKTGDTMTGTLQLPAGTTALPSLVFTGSTTTGLSANSNNLSFSTNGTEQFKISSTGILSVDAFTTAGLVHNDASGNLSSSLIVNADVSPTAGITDSKLATISTAGKVANSATTATSVNTPSTIVLRDGSGNFSAGTITANLIGNASTATTTPGFTGSLVGDVTGTQSATVVSFVGGQTAANVGAAVALANAATSSNIINTLVKRDGSGNFSTGTITFGGNIVLTTEPSTSTAGNIIKGANRFIHDFGTNNIFVGINAGNFTTSGTGSNSGFGSSALTALTTGNNNTAIGANALLTNTTGSNNVAVGSSTLQNNTVSNNTAVGFQALTANTTGTQNSAFGNSALAANTTGNNNTAIGSFALTTNAIGIENVAVGYQALQNNTVNQNSAFGAHALAANNAGTQNTAIGWSALAANTTGNNNTALGYNALATNVTGSNNTAIGTNALTVNTVNSNTAIGSSALAANTAGTSNTAVGSSTLAANTTGISNTAVGSSALAANTIGTSNTAVGSSTLAVNTTGISNTAVGSSALAANTIGTSNTAVGSSALAANTTGINNTAIGSSALVVNTTGTSNTAIGSNTLAVNATGTDSTAIGFNALAANIVSSNTAIGSGALTANTGGAFNVAIGYQALTANTTGASNVAIGYQALTANTIGTQNIAIGNGALAAGGATDIGIGTNALANITGADSIGIGYQALNSGNNAQSLGIGSSALSSANNNAGNNIALGYQAMMTANCNLNIAIGVNTLTGVTGTGGNVGIGSNTLVGFGGQNAIVIGNNSASGAQNIGISNTIIGNNAFTANIAGNLNTAIGTNTLAANTSGSSNLAIGYQALFANTTGNQNAAIGYQALLANTIGSNNVAIGNSALTALTTGTENTAVGASALAANTTGSDNSALGYQALLNNLASGNSAMGYQALAANTTGISNSAFGYQTLLANTTGIQNSAFGYQTLLANTTGSNNTAMGNSALATNVSGIENTAMGYQALQFNTASLNTAIGAYALQMNTTGTQNTAAGWSSLQNNTIGSNNSALGYQTLAANTTGIQNCACGYQALLTNTIGGNNSALGYQALLANTTGNSNTAIGSAALIANTIGIQNTAAGSNALLSNVTGSNNVAIGFSALQNSTVSNNTAVGTSALTANTTGIQNTAVGSSALTTNITGNNNTAVGYNALTANTTGNNNSAVGNNGLAANTTGIQNSALGSGTLAANTIGTNNSAIGFNALTANTTGIQNTAFGSGALSAVTTGTGNIAVGFNAGNALTSTESNDIYIGNVGVAAESNAIRIGTNGTQTTCFIQGIFGVTVSGGTAVSILSNGQLGTVTSSQRFKHAIQDMNDASSDIYKLRPVTFVYNNDETEAEQYGLIAEEVSEIFPTLVIYDENNEPYTVRYDVLPALILNELQKHNILINKLTQEVAYLTEGFNSLKVH